MKNKANWDSFVLTGCNADPTDRDGIVSPLPIEYATQQVLGIGVFDFFTWGQATLLNKRVYISIAITHANPNTNTNSSYTLFSFMYDSAKPKFSGSSRNIPLNAVMYVTKQATTPVVWLNPIPIDCFIDPDGHVKINIQCQYSLPNDFFVQVCDSYALYNQ
ncbi:MAG: hypothetical protein EZS28_003020 [Streblomastix strix]|uniref:Uncharacterized protein n=1 Tax=Streblomastix strix TaxID=222440 RepID=A0A5J4X2M8_9EUKA|nr:MAG: hypothetical protein EZS28_003015 [Streblomastix strix]KAA6401458.1 MAG: hypothetical protein EZS28_003020 [Streblomastix strix]